MSKHDWNKKSLIWLDYDENIISGKNYMISDLGIMGRNCKENHIIFISVNSKSPNLEFRKNFLKKFELYISPHYKSLKWTQQKFFSELLQNILINILKKNSEYNDFKFFKLCSFKYRDGAPMYTLGGIFTDKLNLLDKLRNLYPSISTDEKKITKINLPKITYKEKFYLDQNINYLEEWLDNPDQKKIEFELNVEEVQNYLKYYKYFPQYYEGII